MARFKKLDKKKILEMYKKGMEMGEVAEKNGCSRSSVYKVAKAAGILRNEVDRGKICALAKAGWSVDKIADEMGLSRQQIIQSLKGGRQA